MSDSVHEKFSKLEKRRMYDKIRRETLRVKRKAEMRYSGQLIDVHLNYAVIDSSDEGPPDGVVTWAALYNERYELMYDDVQKVRALLERLCK